MDGLDKHGRNSRKSQNLKTDKSKQERKRIGGETEQGPVGQYQKVKHSGNWSLTKKPEARAKGITK